MRKTMRCIHAIVACAALLPVACWAQGSDYGQFAPPDAFEDDSGFAYYGSENTWGPRQFSERSADRFYKRRGQRQIFLILEGRPHEAIASSQRYLQREPDDLESLFTLVIAQCQLGKRDEAFRTMQRAIAAGLPFERFIAGPRDLLAPLAQSAEFQQFLEERPIRLLHGPMLGAVTDTSARFWVRTAEEAEIAVRVFTADEDEPLQTGMSRTDKAMDYTGIASVENLQPDTIYSYDVVVDGASALEGPRPTLRTCPRRGQPLHIRVAFGGCAGYTPHHERMWDTIHARQPAALLLLGDNVYIDLPTEAGPLHRYTYYRRQSRPEFRRLVAQTPVYAIWDDHDAAVDDIWMGPYRDRPTWKPSMLQLQKENWNNPTYGDPEWPACWFRFSIGDVDFFMLDGRYYRTNPFAPQPTMLGPVQKKWLLRGLRDSKATFKILSSPVGWAQNVKPGSRDTWDGFPEEREEIFSWIEENEIEGVVLLSADRHRSEAWRIERPKGYTLYDLLSARLTNIHTHEPAEGAMFVYNEKCSFGLLTLDTTRPDPTLMYDIINIDDEVIHSLTLTKSQLSMPRDDSAAQH